MLDGALEVISVGDFIEIIMSETIFGTGAFFHDIVACKYVMGWGVFFFGFGFDDSDWGHMVVFFLVARHTKRQIEVYRESFFRGFVYEGDAFVSGDHISFEFLTKITAIDSLMCVIDEISCCVIDDAVLVFFYSVSVFSDHVVISVFELEKVEIGVDVASGSDFDSVLFSSIVCVIKITSIGIKIDAFVGEYFFAINCKDIKILH